MKFRLHFLSLIIAVAHDKMVAIADHGYRVRKIQLVIETHNGGSHKHLSNWIRVGLLGKVSDRIVEELNLSTLIPSIRWGPG